MKEEGVLEDVALIFGGHVDRHHDPGTIVVTDGTVNAATDAFFIDIHGQQGHGARPHEALDAIVAGSLLVTAIQTIVSREVDPAHPSVVSVGSFHAGQASNVIAGTARLEGTIRSHDPELRESLKDSVRRIANAIGQLHGAEVEIAFRGGTPALINRPDMTELSRRAAQRVLPSEHIQELRTANMGGEDFAYFLEDVPGCYVRFGSKVPGRELYPAHSSKFDFSEVALTTGAAWLASVAREASEQLSTGVPAGKTS